MTPDPFSSPDYDNAAVYIFSDPNDGNGTNEVMNGQHLNSLNLNIAAAPTMQTAVTAANDKRIKYGTATEVTITGTDLIGNVTLEKAVPGQQPLVKAASWARVKKTDGAKLTSDLKEMKVRIAVPFNGPYQPSDGWVLKITNERGSSSITGFEIVQQ